MVSSQPLRGFGAALSPDQLPRRHVNWRGRGESNSFRRSGAPALNQSTTSANLKGPAFAIGWLASRSACRQACAVCACLTALPRRLAEGEGVEPSTVRSARFSGPVARRRAPPSELVVPARLERATSAFGQRRSAPLSYGTEIAHLREPALNWSGWLDSNQRPPASEAGTLAGLSYTLLALRREIESLSPDRQSGRLTRSVTERRNLRPAKRVSAKQDGASGPTRTATECALNALPLPIGVQTRSCEMEDQAGFEPAVSLRCRLKRPARSTATETGPVVLKMADPGGYDPHADGLKVRSLSIRV